MRELKFRVWCPTSKHFSTLPWLSCDGLMMKWEHTSNESTLTDIRFDEYIIQQYTGLKDKNGKEIYEGDIFKGGDYKWDAVEFEDGQFEVNLIGARVFSLQELCCDYDSERPEVIGNIFENPELLE